MNDQRPGSKLVRLVELFQKALDGTGLSLHGEEKERSVLLLHQAMTGRSRAFHQLDHLFEVCDGLAPIEMFAMLYHDVVYFEIDRGIIPGVEKAVAATVKSGKDAMLVRNKQLDPASLVVLQIFGIKPGQPVPAQQKRNEFLSALYVAREFGKVLSLEQIAVIATCIEATIPFRGPDKKGLTAAESMARTLTKVSKSHRWHWTEEQIEAVVRSAVRCGNADVRNFASPDPGRFLDNTWKLLPESNPELQAMGAYTVSKYRSALERMERFLGTLDARNVFHDYRGYPSPSEMSQLISRTEANLKIAVLYLQVKLVSIALIEAIARLTGGDAPVAFLIGPPPEEDPKARQIQDYLPDAATFRPRNFVAPNHTVFSLLNTGRPGESDFDTKGSPLSAYLYAALGDAEIRSVAAKAKQAFSGKLPWALLLKAFPGSLVSAMASAIAGFALTRRDRLQALAKAQSMRDSSF